MKLPTHFNFDKVDTLNQHKMILILPLIESFELLNLFLIPIFICSYFILHKIQHEISF